MKIDKTSPERWQPVLGWPYEVSTHGRARSLPRRRGRRLWPGRLLKVVEHIDPARSAPRRQFTLSDGPRRATYYFEIQRETHQHAH